MSRIRALRMLPCRSSVPLAALGIAADPPALPETPKKPVTDDYHGVKVVDDYRWLEKTDDPTVRKWVEAQNAVTEAYFAKRKDLPALRKRLTELMAAESPSFGGLQYGGKVLFALKRQPPMDQLLLVTLDSVDKPESAKVVLDLNKLDPKGKTSIDFFVPSRDGKLVALSLSVGGSEEGTL